MSANTDRNLLFGVLALQAGLLDARQFAEACSAWAARKDTPMDDLLVEHGLLTAEDRSLLAALLEKNIKKHSGDARASLAAVAAEPARQALSSVDDPAIQESLSGFETPEGPGLSSTSAYQPASRDRYTLTRLHATGGIGQVWLAHDEALGREVALKELRPEKGPHPAALARFLEEAKIASQLQHPSIVPVYELARGGDGKPPFYTMRFVRGRMLADAIRAYHQERQAGAVGPLALRELLNAFIDVCNAVAYAHSRGVLHRDLKPANVVLGDYGEVILVDWGLAKARGAEDSDSSLLPVALVPEEGRGETVQGQVLGTPGYMPPEQAEGRLDLVDERSDVYGLGAILYSILTGQAPFPGSDKQAVLVQVMRERPVAPRRLVAGTPAALEAVCLKALAKRATDRYASAREVADEVKHFLADEPVSAHREPVAARMGRWVRRHRTGVIAVGAALAVAVVGLAVATWLLTGAYRQAEHQRDQAQAQRDRARDYLRMARDAVQQYHTGVSDSPELKAHGLEKLRGKLLEKASAFYEEFARSQDQDPEIMAERGRAYYLLGAVRNEMGQAREAEAAYRDGLALFGELVAGHPDDPEYRLEQARGHDGLGVVYYDGGKGEEAAKEHSEEVAICQALVAAHPNTVAYRFQLGRAYRGLADAHFIQLRYPAMRQAAEEAVTHLRGALEGSPASAEVQLELARALDSAGTAAGKTDAGKEALKFLDEAIAIYRQLVAGHPDVPEYQDRMADAMQSLGVVYSNNLRQAEEATRMEKEAVDVCQRLVRDHPDVPLYRFRLALLWTSLGTGYHNRRRLQEAKTCLESSNAIYSQLIQQYPANEKYKGYSFECKVFLALVTVAMGDYSSAVEQTERVLREKPRSEICWYNAACVYSLAVPPVRKDEKLPAARRMELAQQYGARAVELLHEAVAHGLALVGALREDADLEPVRDRDDFKKLLEELEKKAGGKK
jgi:serine/threonine-protein kinase